MLTLSPLPEDVAGITALLSNFSVLSPNSLSWSTGKHESFDKLLRDCVSVVVVLERKGERGGMANGEGGAEREAEGDKGSM